MYNIYSTKYYIIQDDSPIMSTPFYSTDIDFFQFLYRYYT